MFVFYMRLSYLFNSAAESNGQNAGITDSRIPGSIKAQTYFNFNFTLLVHTYMYCITVISLFDEIHLKTFENLIKF